MAVLFWIIILYFLFLFINRQMMFFIIRKSSIETNFSFDSSDTNIITALSLMSIIGTALLLINIFIFWVKDSEFFTPKEFKKKK